MTSNAMPPTARKTATVKNRITTAEQLEAIIGRPSAMVRMKELAELDDACRDMLAVASLAGFGHLDADGRPRTTVIGGSPGFARPESPTRLAIATDLDVTGPVSFVFLMPGVGETLRVNGTVADRTPGHLAITIEQAYVHCARAILRSRLWSPSGQQRLTTSAGLRATAITTDDPPPPGKDAPGHPAADRPPEALGDHLRPPAQAGAPGQPPADAEGHGGPLSEPGVREVLAATPFLVLSSWDGNGSSDTSPRGDVPGFVRVVDGHTLAIPDRRGNKRADTSRNLLTDGRISAAALVPGSTDVLHLNGTAVPTDDPDLLAGMAQGSAVPQLALVVTVEQAEVRHNQALADADIWDASAHADDATRTELMASTTRQLAAKTPALRGLAKLLAVFARLLRRAIDATYRRALRKEGYDLPAAHTATGASDPHERQND
ncbi:pyridoxamine 5'-phosphate oxidase family protein [Nonomuraea sp. NPDC049419]|uniref:pyridoxamine 5'-phosphate oxidase family protein n=1 Tax=Nonomuraea sp. NPDC049419 TaxID=3155772 RepID=UPI00342BDC74